MLKTSQARSKHDYFHQKKIFPFLRFLYRLLFYQIYLIISDKSSARYSIICVYVFIKKRYTEYPNLDSSTLPPLTIPSQNRDLFIRSSRLSLSAPRLLNKQSYAPGLRIPLRKQKEVFQGPSGGRTALTTPEDSGKTHKELMVSHPPQGVFWESSRLKEEE